MSNDMNRRFLDLIFFSFVGTWMVGVMLVDSNSRKRSSVLRARTHI